MGKSDDPVEAARVLAISTWRRDFERDPDLRRQVHDQEVGKFLASLKEEFGRIPANLHDEHALSASDDWKTLVLTEGQPQAELVRCLIDTSNPGFLYFQYRWGLEEESKEEVRLARQGKDAYAWYQGGTALHFSAVARLCLVQLCKHANSIIAAEVSFNPGVGIE